jgi:crotonobetainyl-CoA:carnitine CoA-transferase CaiB-like acyl-CoA transferase
MNAENRSRRGPLKGLKVLEWGENVSAPYCTKLLAGLGADVIKIEKPGVGDESRLHGPFPDDIPDREKSGLFHLLNANKLGVTLDVCSEQGRKIMLELVARADLLVENNSPSLLKEYGLDYASLEKVNPGLVMVSITPFGQTGPYSGYKGYDINVCALGGVSWAIGDPEREPLSLPLSLVHYQSGANAAAAAMAALLAREAMGRGQHVDISEADVLSFYSGSNSLMYIFHGNEWRRAGHRAPDSGGSYPYTILPCKDGYVCMIARSGQEWNRIVKMLGDPDWASEERYQDRQVMGREYPDEVDALILPWLKERSKEEIFHLCREHGVPFAPVRDIADVLNDENFQQRDFFVEIEGVFGKPVKFPGAPFKFSETPWELKSAAPALGQHNREIFCNGLGVTRNEYEQLESEGII